MQEQKPNAKCPYCGAELNIGYDKGTGLCTVCKKQFDNEKAIKLYNSLYEEQKEEQEKTTLSGEQYLELDRVLNRVEFHLERKNFNSAKEELEKALTITTNDYRIYFGFVRVETQNLTDYRNTTHEEYLKKAIDCADSEEKKIILRLYKDFYNLSKLSDEDILQYKKEENVAIKQKIEEKFKDLIPVYMKKERSLKLSLILGIVVAVLSLAGLIVGAILKNEALLVVGSVLLFISYLLFRNFYLTKKANKLFNSLLDFYDQFDNFDFTEAQKREILDAMKLCRKEFANNNNTTGYENSLASLIQIIIGASENARRYILSHETLKEFVDIYED